MIFKEAAIIGSGILRIAIITILSSLLEFLGIFLRTFAIYHALDMVIGSSTWTMDHVGSNNLIIKVNDWIKDLSKAHTWYN